MADLHIIGLTPRSALNGHEGTAGALRITERTGLGIVAAAIPLGGEAAFAEALASHYGLDTPPVGRSSLSADGTRAAMMQLGNLWLMTPGAADTALPRARRAFGGAAWLTDLSDGWCGLRLSDARGGDDLRAALARLSMLDIHALPDGAATRTVMEHLSVVILMEGAAVTLLSARSSARDLLRAVEISARNAAPPRAP